MRFIFRMAWRDSRASRRRLILFSLSIVFGIAALVALGSFSAGLGQAVRTQTKDLLGADLVVSARSEPVAALGAYLGSLGSQTAKDVLFSSMMVFPEAGGATRLVQVRAMEGNFPFYGEFVTEPATAVARLREAFSEGDPQVVVLEDTLLIQFGLKTGDKVKLGHSFFTVIGALKKIPGESLAVSLLAPRAFVPLRSLVGAGLDPNGALVNHRIAVKLPPNRDPEAVASDVRIKFGGGERLSVDTVARRQRELGRTLSNIDAFLSLVGFVALLLGAIGVASAVQVYIRQKRSTVAILRCLGSPARQSFSIYLIQGFALGLVGSVVGALFGILIQWILPSLLKGILPLDVDFSISWAAVARGTGAGLIISVLFTLLPLLGVRRVSPLAALRNVDSEAPAAASDPWFVVICAAIAIAVVGFAVWQVGSKRIGLGFAGVLGLSLGILGLLARLTAWASRRFAPRRAPYVIRQGIANLHRPNNRTVLLLLSLGLGTFLILTLAFTRSALLHEIAGTGSEGRPNLIFFDIQSDQIGPLDKLLADHGTPVAVQAPIVTMKIASIKGRSAADWMKDGGADLPGWALRREYRSTFRGSVAATERIVAGTFVGRVDPGQEVVPISVEESLANDLRLKLGDEVDWDVQGVILKSRVGSLRTVEWRRLEPNFFVVFPEGVLDQAPKFFVAAVRAPSAASSAELQRFAVHSFPNVTAIDLSLVLSTLDGIFDKVTFVVDFMALFTVATGLIVLVGAVINGRLQRRRETVLLRSLGATGSQVARIQLVEYAVLGLLAALVGSVLAVGASALLAHSVFHIAPSAPPATLVGALALVSALTVSTGWLAERGLLSQSPLEVLRAECE